MFLPQLAKLTSDAELKARQAAASKAVLAAAQQAQREGRLLEASEIAEIRWVGMDLLIVHHAGLGVGGA